MMLLMFLTYQKLVLDHPMPLQTNYMVLSHHKMQTALCQKWAELLQCGVIFLQDGDAHHYHHDLQCLLHA
jgi:hypothetical protein